ncbi:hypothetical protein AVEN_138012-1, partial [Araneus ventricosus]
RNDICPSTYDLACPIHDGSSVESGFEPGTLRPPTTWPRYVYGIFYQIGKYHVYIYASATTGLVILILRNNPCIKWEGPYII